jgi:peptidoglycan DL-endopeptidase CwlO
VLESAPVPSLPQLIRRSSWALLLVFVMLAAIAATTGLDSARADQIESKQAEARAVEAHVNQLNAQVDSAVNAYNEANVQLRRANTRVVQNAALLKVARTNLKAARHQLAKLLVAGYKGQAPQVEVYVLGATSISNLVDRIDFVARTDNGQKDILNQIHTSERAIAAHQKALVADRAAARHLVRTRTAQRRHIQSLLSAQQSYLASIKSDIANLIKQRQAAERAAARRAAAAAAAQQAAQQAATPKGGGATTTQTGNTGGGGGTDTGGGGGGTVTIPPAGSLGEKAVQIAEQEIGVPYVWGGSTPAGFDCSGLTMWVYAQLGIHLDHYTGSQWNEGVHVPRDQLQPGDLVFFEPTLGHVGMYIGNGAFIHAPHTGTTVQISSLSGWYAAEYQGAVRVTG